MTGPRLGGEHRRRAALLGVSVSAVLLGLVVWNVRLGEVAAHLSRTRWEFFVLSMAAGISMMGVRGLRWRCLFHPEIQRPWLLASATTVGYMANNVLPFRAGELVRAYLVAERGRLPFLTVVGTLAVERVLDLLTLLLVLGAVVLLVPVPPLLRGAGLALLAVGLAALGLLLAAARAPGWLSPRLLDRLRRSPTLDRVLGDFVAGARCLTPGPHLLPLVGWTVALWAVNVTGVWLALRAAALQVPLVAAFTVLAFIGLGVSLPSGPGYLGNVQFFAMSALALYGVEGAEAVSFSILMHAANFIPITAAGGLLVTLSPLLRDARGQRSDAGLVAAALAGSSLASRGDR